MIHEEVCFLASSSLFLSSIFIDVTINSYSFFFFFLPELGTLRWRAPETFGNNPTWSPEADVYSLGVTLFKIATRTVPFADVCWLLIPVGDISSVTNFFLFSATQIRDDERLERLVMQGSRPQLDVPECPQVTSSFASKRLVARLF